MNNSEQNFDITHMTAMAQRYLYNTYYITEINILQYIADK